MTDVVLVCSPPIVATAKGSGNPAISIDQHVRVSSEYAYSLNTSRLYSPSAAMTVYQ